MYRVEWTEKARKSLKNLDKKIAIKLKNKVDKELSRNPYDEGEPLKGNLKGKWSFHYASYRVIYQIFQSELLVLVLEGTNRKDSYKSYKSF